MKISQILPVIAVLPTCAFADFDASYRIRPYVGYEIGLASTRTLKAKNDSGTVVRSNSMGLNDNNVGDFVLGLEFRDVMAVAIKPSLDRVRTKVAGVTEDDKMYEVDALVDIYLTRNSSIKPYIHLGVGYVGMDGAVEARGAMFGFGVGCRQYISKNVYLNAGLVYDMSTKMDVKKINGVKMDDTTMRINGLSLNIGLGYRF